MIRLDLCNALGSWGNFTSLRELLVKLDKILQSLKVVRKLDGLRQNCLTLIHKLQFIASIAVSSTMRVAFSRFYLMVMAELELRF